MRPDIVVVVGSIGLEDLAQGCPDRELYPTIFMMKSAEDLPGGDVTEPSNRTSKRCVFGQR